jgi:hypothetical protein
MMNETTALVPPPESSEVLAQGRMLECVAGGLVLAIISFAVVVYAAYHGWYAHDLSRDWAYAGIGYGFTCYSVGVFIFSYGWQGGDMAKSLRLAFFICASTLVVIVALVMLLRARADAAAKSAGIIESAGEADFNGVALLESAGSMLMGEEDEPEGEKLSRDSGVFQMICSHCGASFAPAPPKAECPFCHTTALSAS